MQDDTVTQLLAKLRGGEVEALDDLVPIIYDQLKRLARVQLRREDTGHTLGPTALVHEAYVRLSDRERLQPADRHHFLSIFAQAMRRVLIEHARARNRTKRGSGVVAVPLSEVEDWLSDSAASELVSLDEALDRLEVANLRAAQVVQHRFFGGLSLEETAEVMTVSTKTVQRDWMLARAWLRKEIDSDVLQETPRPARAEPMGGDDTPTPGVHR